MSQSNHNAGQGGTHILYKGSLAESQPTKQQAKGKNVAKSNDPHKRGDTSDKYGYNESSAAKSNSKLPSSSSRRGVPKPENSLEIIQSELKQASQGSTQQRSTQRKKSKNGSTEAKSKDAKLAKAVVESQAESQYPTTRSRKSQQRHVISRASNDAQKSSSIEPEVYKDLHRGTVSGNFEAVQEQLYGQMQPVSSKPHQARRIVSGYSKTLGCEIDSRFDPPALKRYHKESPKLVFASPRNVIGFRYFHEDDLIQFADPSLAEKIIDQTMDQDYDTDESIERNTTHKMIKIFEGTLGLAGYDAKGRIRMIKRHKEAPALPAKNPQASRTTTISIPRANPEPQVIVAQAIQIEPKTEPEKIADRSVSAELSAVTKNQASKIKGESGLPKAKRTTPPNPTIQGAAPQPSVAVINAKLSSLSSSAKPQTQTLFKPSPEPEASRKTRSPGHKGNQAHIYSESTRATARNTHEPSSSREEKQSKDKPLAAIEKISFYNKLLEETEAATKNTKPKVVKVEALGSSRESSQKSVVEKAKLQKSVILAEEDDKKQQGNSGTKKKESESRGAEGAVQQPVDVFKQAISQGLLERHFSGLLKTIEELVSNVCKSVPESSPAERFLMAKICLENLQSRAQLADGHLVLKSLSSAALQEVAAPKSEVAKPAISGQQPSSRGVTQEKVAQMLSKQAWILQGSKAAKSGESEPPRPHQIRSESHFASREESKQKAEQRWSETYWRDILNKKSEAGTDKSKLAAAPSREFGKFQPTRTERKIDLGVSLGSKTMQKYEDQVLFESDYLFPMKREASQKPKPGRDSSVPPQSNSKSYGYYKVVEGSCIEVSGRDGKDKDKTNDKDKDKDRSSDSSDRRDSDAKGDKGRRTGPLSKVKLDSSERSGDKPRDKSETTPISKRTRSGTVYVEVEEQEHLGKRKRRETGKGSEDSGAPYREIAEAWRARYDQSRDKSQPEPAKKGTMTEHKLAHSSRTGLLPTQGYLYTERSKSRALLNNSTLAHTALDRSYSPVYRR